MSRQFSIPTVLRMVPNALLEQFLARFNVGASSIDWQAAGEWEIVPEINDLINRLDRPRHTDIECALRSVFDLACDTGIDAIFEAASKSGDVDMPLAMPIDKGPYAKAMWTWLHRPDAFERALLLHQVESLTWWRKRRDLPKTVADMTDEARQRLGESISGLFQQTQGRGHVCSVECFSRSDGTDYFFVYPDDFVQNVTAHNDQRILTARTHRQTFVIVFAYNSHDGTLELFARVAPKLKIEHENLFAKMVLGTELETWRTDAAYELDHLLDRNFALATDPEDRVHVCIRKMRLSFRNSGRRIWLEVDGEHDNIHDMMDDCLNRENVSGDQPGYGIPSSEENWILDQVVRIESTPRMERP
jgi:hypothetical protein